MIYLENYLTEQQMAAVNRTLQRDQRTPVIHPARALDVIARGQGMDALLATRMIRELADALRSAPANRTPA